MGAHISASPICVSSYDVLVKLPQGERIHLGDGNLVLQFEERFVIHSQCGASLQAKDLPPSVVLIKKFTDPAPLTLDSVFTSTGEVEWATEKATDADSEGQTHLAQVKITLSLVGKNLASTSGVRLTLKWHVPRDLPWIINTELDRSHLGWTDLIDLPVIVTDNSKGTDVTDLYDKSTMSYTLVVPRTKPRLTAEVTGRVWSTLNRQDPSQAAVLVQLEPAGNRGYGGWDVYTFESRLVLSDGLSRPELPNVIWNLTQSLSKSASEPFGFVSDIPISCEPYMEQPHLLVWQYVVGYAAFMFVSRLLFGLDAVFATNSKFLVRLVRHGWKLILVVATLIVWLYIYKDVRGPSCTALYGPGRFPWVVYFFWTVLPSAVFVLLAWPIWLNTMASERTEEVAEQLLALKKGEQQRERGRSKLFIMFCRALAPSLYLGIVIFQYRVFVTDVEIVDAWMAGMMSLVVCVPVWLSRVVWRPEPKYISDRLLLLTFTLPFVLAVLWHSIF